MQICITLGFHPQARHDHELGRHPHLSRPDASALLARRARSLGVDQATVGRRLNALEAKLGAKLFLRAKDGYLLTAAG